MDAKEYHKRFREAYKDSAEHTLQLGLGRGDELLESYESFDRFDTLFPSNKAKRDLIWDIEENARVSETMADAAFTYFEREGLIEKIDGKYVRTPKATKLRDAGKLQTDGFF